MKLFQLDESDIDAAVGGVIGAGVCPPNPGFDDPRARVMQLTGARREPTYTANSIVWTGSSPFGPFDPYFFWANYYDAVGGIYKSGHPYQAKIPATGIQLAFDYLIEFSITPISGSPVGHVDPELFVDFFGAIIESQDFIGGDGAAQWDDFNNVDLTVDDTYSASGSVLLSANPPFVGSPGFIMMEISALPQFSITGGNANWTYNIELTNFEWICE